MVVVVAVVVDSVVISTQSYLERRVGVVVVGFKLKHATWAHHQSDIRSSQTPARCPRERGNDRVVEKKRPMEKGAPSRRPVSYSGSPFAGSLSDCHMPPPCVPYYSPHFMSPFFLDLETEATPLDTANTPSCKRLPSFPRPTVSVDLRQQPLPSLEIITNYIPDFALRTGSQ